MNTKTTESTNLLCCGYITMVHLHCKNTTPIALVWELSLYNDCAVDRELAVSKHKFVGALVEVSKMTINLLIIVHRKFGMHQINVIA